MAIYNTSGDDEGTIMGKSGGKVGFYGKAPASQAANIAAETSSVTTTKFNQVLSILSNLGLMAAS